MPLGEARTEQFVEAFEVLGKRAPTVDRETMGSIMRALGQNPTNDEVKGLFEKVAAGASSITCEQLLIAAGEFEEQNLNTDPKVALREAFKVFDKDNTGSISSAELRHIIANLGETVDEDEVEEMMAEADKDGNGKIDYSEFVGVLFNSVRLPPPVVISDELKPYWDALQSRVDPHAKKP